MQERFRTLLTILPVLMLILALGACDGSGGGSDGGSDTGPVDDPGGAASTRISGIAAAGAPLQGFVHALDKYGVSVSCPIENDGSYALDVSGLTPPFLIYAKGIAGGKYLELYSYLDELSARNRTNVTPATHLAVASALGANPAELRSHGLLVIPGDMEEKVEEALELLQEKLSAVLSAQGLTGIDLRSSSFIANGSGLDAVFDTVDFRVASTGAATLISLVDRASGTTMLERDMATGLNSVDLSSAVIAVAVNGAITEKKAIEQAFREFLVGCDTRNAGLLRALYADDALDDGRGPDDSINAIVSGADAFGGTLVSVSILRPMASYTFSDGLPALSEYGNHAKGYWIAPTINFQGALQSGVLAYVQDSSGKWLLYGNRCPVDWSEADARRQMIVAADGHTSFTSGLDLANGEPVAEDLPLMVVMGPGIGFANFRTKAATGATRVDTLVNSLPQTIEFQGQSLTRGLTLYSPDSSSNFEAFNATPDSLYLVTEDDGLKLSEIEDNSEYRFIAFDALGRPKYSWMILCMEKPIAKADLSEDDFPRLLSVDGSPLDHALSSLSLPNFSATWKNLTDVWVERLEYGIWHPAWQVMGEVMDNPADNNPALNLADWTSIDVTNAPVTSTQTFAVTLRGQNKAETEILMTWQWAP